LPARVVLAQSATTGNRELRTSNENGELRTGNRELAVEALLERGAGEGEYVDGATRVLNLLRRAPAAAGSRLLDSPVFSVFSLLIFM
jgi:hypothetical protein